MTIRIGAGLRWRPLVEKRCKAYCNALHFLGHVGPRCPMCDEFARMQRCECAVLTIEVGP